MVSAYPLVYPLVNLYPLVNPLQMLSGISEDATKKKFTIGLFYILISLQV